MVYVTTAIAMLALWRWWHWKREAYKTRDAAFQSFRALHAIVDRSKVVADG